MDQVHPEAAREGGKHDISDDQDATSGILVPGGNMANEDGEQDGVLSGEFFTPEEEFTAGVTEIK